MVLALSILKGPCKFSARSRLMLSWFVSRNVCSMSSLTSPVFWKCLYSMALMEILTTCLTTTSLSSTSEMAFFSPCLLLSKNKYGETAVPLTPSCNERSDELVLVYNIDRHNTVRHAKCLRSASP